MGEGFSLPVAQVTRQRSSARPAARRQTSDEDDLRELVADIRSRMDAQLACLTRQASDDRQPETLAVDASDGVALSRLPDLVGSIARPSWRWSPVHQPITVNGTTLRITVNLDDGGWATLLLHRRGEAGWNDGDLRAARDLHGEMLRYMRLWWRHRSMHRRCSGFQAALDLNDIGILLLDGGANLMFANRTATALLDAKDGLRQFGASITASRMEDAVRLQTAILHVVGHEGDKAREAPITLVHRQRDVRPLIVAVLPIDRPSHDASAPAAVVYIIDPDAQLRGLIEPACRVYGLTGVEVRLVRHLVDGATLADAARLMRIKPQTAKAYLKQIFAKTGVHRQADLVRVLLASLLRTAAPVELAVL